MNFLINFSQGHSLEIVFRVDKNVLTSLELDFLIAGKSDYVFLVFCLPIISYLILIQLHFALIHSNISTLNKNLIIPFFQLWNVAL